MSAMVSSISMCVLGSGSGGNCTALVIPDEGRANDRRVMLIDLGLSPRQTNLRLAQVGLTLDDVTNVLITHFDRDHYYETWNRLLPPSVTLHMHDRHRGIAGRSGALYHRSSPFSGPFHIDHVQIDPILVAHDSLGAVAFRISVESGALGFITDCGRITDQLITHMSGVDVLAIESNYDPVMEAESGRPPFLIRRVTGGDGHLSNGEARKAVERIGPAGEIVLLHLSQQCNDPCIIRELYETDLGLTDRLVITDQKRPARWVHVGPAKDAMETCHLIEPELFA